MSWGLNSMDFGALNMAKLQDKSWFSQGSYPTIEIWEFDTELPDVVRATTCQTQMFVDLAVEDGKARLKMYSLQP